MENLLACHFGKTWTVSEVVLLMAVYLAQCRGGIMRPREHAYLSTRRHTIVILNY